MERGGTGRTSRGIPAYRRSQFTLYRLVKGKAMPLPKFTPFPYPFRIGTDICHIPRILALLRGRHGSAFIRKVLRPEEREQSKIENILKEYARCRTKLGMIAASEREKGKKKGTIAQGKQKEQSDGKTLELVRKSKEVVPQKHSNTVQSLVKMELEKRNGDEGASAANGVVSANLLREKEQVLDRRAVEIPLEDDLEEEDTRSSGFKSLTGNQKRMIEENMRRIQEQRSGQRGGVEMNNVGTERSEQSLVANSSDLRTETSSSSGEVGVQATADTALALEEQQPGQETKLSEMEQLSERDLDPIKWEFEQLQPSPSPAHIQNMEQRLQQLEQDEPLIRAELAHRNNWIQTRESELRERMKLEGTIYKTANSKLRNSWENWRKKDIEKEAQDRWAEEERSIPALEREARLLEKEKERIERKRIQDLVSAWRLRNSQKTKKRNEVDAWWIKVQNQVLAETSKKPAAEQLLSRTNNQSFSVTPTNPPPSPAKSSPSRSLTPTLSRPDPQILQNAETALRSAASFLAGRFAAKEAVIKAHSSRRLTYHEILILKPDRKDGETGSLAPVGIVVDEESEGSEVRGKEVKISISHDGEYATAVCLAVD